MQIIQDHNMRNKVMLIQTHFLISNFSQISQGYTFILASISADDLAQWFSNFPLYYNH